MNRKIRFALLALGAAVLSSSIGWAQSLARVQGKATDAEGKPIVGAKVEFLGKETGQRYSFKTDKKGEYFSIGVQTGTYKVSLVQDDKVIFSFNDVPVSLASDDAMNTINFDMAREQANAAAPPGQKPGAKKLTPEQMKAIAEAQKKNAEIQKENSQIKVLNDKLAQAKVAEDAGNLDQAIAILTEATAMGPNRDLLWARLGEAELSAGAAAAPKDKEAATAHYEKAAVAYKKAVELKPAEGAYHNNLGQAYAKSGKPTEALAEYTTAAQDDPTHAAIYYFNLGAILTNQATREAKPDVKAKDIEEANASFDKAIAVKPDYGEAWYQKGINLISKATFDKSGKMVPAEGTVEAFNKYLELEPQGKHAEEAKGIITGLGETVQTSYKKGKTTKK